MPAAKHHRYSVTIQWTGANGVGTRDYRSYERAHEIRAEGKPSIAGSSDPAFRGDPKRWNPEELLVASLSACHKLWYLHFCAVNGIVVVEYIDEAEGLMVEDEAKGGYFTRVVLRPRVRIASGDIAKAKALHSDAHAKCFIANSVNFEVAHEPTVTLA